MFRTTNRSEKKSDNGESPMVMIMMMTIMVMTMSKCVLEEHIIDKKCGAQ